MQAHIKLKNIKHVTLYLVYYDPQLLLKLDCTDFSAGIGPVQKNYPHIECKLFSIIMMKNEFASLPLLC